MSVIAMTSSWMKLISNEVLIHLFDICLYCSASVRDKELYKYTFIYILLISRGVGCQLWAINRLRSRVEVTTRRSRRSRVSQCASSSQPALSHPPRPLLTNISRCRSYEFKSMKLGFVGTRCWYRISFPVVTDWNQTNLTLGVHISSPHVTYLLYFCTSYYHIIISYIFIYEWDKKCDISSW